MKIKKIVSGKKIALLVAAGVLVAVTASAFYLSQGGLFKGFIGEQIGQLPILKNFSGITCASTPRASALVGADVTWTVANFPQTIIAYTWSGDTGTVVVPKQVVGQSAHIFKTSYLDKGQKHVQVLLKQNNYNPKVVDCGSINIEAAQPIPVVQQLAPFTATCTASAATGIVGDIITYTAKISGGIGPYVTKWSNLDVLGSPGDNAGTNTYKYAFTKIGVKTVKMLTVTDSALPKGSVLSNISCPAISITAAAKIIKFPGQL